MLWLLSLLPTTPVTLCCLLINGLCSDILQRQYNGPAVQGHELIISGPSQDVHCKFSTVCLCARRAQAPGRWLPWKAADGNRFVSAAASPPGLGTQLSLAPSDVCSSIWWGRQLRQLGGHSSAAWASEWSSELTSCSPPQHGVLIFFFKKYMDINILKRHMQKPLLLS